MRDPTRAWQLRRVTVGPNNDSFVVIEQGLAEGDVVAINPDLLWEDTSRGIPEPGEPPGPSSSGDVARSGP